jgi:hypothetical protein
VLRAFACFQKVEEIPEFDEARSARHEAQALEPSPACDRLTVALDQRPRLDVGQEFCLCFSMVRRSARASLTSDDALNVSGGEWIVRFRSPMISVAIPKDTSLLMRRCTLSEWPATAISAISGFCLSIAEPVMSGASSFRRHPERLRDLRQVVRVRPRFPHFIS